AREKPECDPGVLHVVDPERPGDVDAVVECEMAGDDVLRQLVRGDGGERDRDEAEPLDGTCAQRALGDGDRRECVGGGADSHVYAARRLAHERLSFRPRSDDAADASRRSITPGPTPVNSMILSRAP